MVKGRKKGKVERRKRRRKDDEAVVCEVDFAFFVKIVKFRKSINLFYFSFLLITNNFD